MSYPGGFALMGPFAPGEGEDAVAESLQRLRSGEVYLAVSDDCGTTLLANGVLTTAAVLAITRRNRFANLPFAITAAIVIGRFAPQVGRWLQRQLTTDARLGDLNVTAVRTLGLPRGVAVVHVTTANR
jgi:fructose-1,6-bisphosphatase/sedoheptulose 1,7-bisphosphatase-like protein